MAWSWNRINSLLLFHPSSGFILHQTSQGLLGYAAVATTTTATATTREEDKWKRKSFFFYSWLKNEKVINDNFLTRIIFSRIKTRIVVIHLNLLEKKWKEKLTPSIYSIFFVGGNLQHQTFRLNTNDVIQLRSFYKPRKLIFQNFQRFLFNLSLLLFGANLIKFWRLKVLHAAFLYVQFVFVLTVKGYW